MGTWGHNNLDSDSASDILYEQSKALVDETLKLAASKAATEYDEYDYDKLFVNFEILFAFERARLLRYHPEPDQVAELKNSYLAAWDAYTKENGDGWEQRRAVIAKTFDRFRWICQKEQRRQGKMPQLVEVKAPSVSELSSELALSPHIVFGDLLVSLPLTWKTLTTDDASKIPEASLTRSLFDTQSGQYSVGEHRFTLERVFLAAGASLARDVESSDNPYLLIGRLQVSEDVDPPDVYGLVCDTEKVLSPAFQGVGEYVSGGVCIDTLEDLEFEGLESFRHLKPGPDWGTRLRCKNLYYHKLSEDTLLLLETGSIEDSVDFHFPDKVLLEHIVDSMSATPKTNNR